MWAAVSLAALLAIIALAVGLTWAPDRPVETLTARWAPPPSTFIDVRGLKVHVRDEGPRDDQVPVVLIHGTSASRHTWEGWVAALKGQRRVITMDLPGFGLTGPNGHDDYRTATYVAFVTDLLDALGVKKCVLAGNSLGGEIAWHAALSSPERIERLILVDSAGYPLQSQSIPIGFRIARIPGLNRIMEFTLPRSLVAASVRNVYGDAARVTQELIDRYEALTLRSGNRRALVRRFEQSDFGADAARIAAIRQPTLILWGGRDRLIPVENARRFAQDIGGSRLVIFDDLGHVPQEEDAARTAAAVREFLKP